MKEIETIIETDHKKEIEINHIEAEEITVEITKDQFIGVDQEKAIDMTIGETTTDKMMCSISKSVIFSLHHDAMLLCKCYVFMLFTHVHDDGATM